MRTVSLRIAALGLSVGDVINIRLINSVGALYVAQNDYSLDEDIALTGEYLTKELLENETLLRITSYRLTLPNSLHFNFVVPASTDASPHDLLPLLNLGCTAGIIDEDTGLLEDDFIVKLNLYFTGENPHFSVMQHDIVSLYEYYADEIKGTGVTIDIMKLMDEYLSTLTGDM